MMGEPVGRQDRLFYEFDLEDMVPGDHLLRRIDAALDLSWLRGEMKAHYSPLGCPSVCPELLVRMLIVGYWGHGRHGPLKSRGSGRHFGRI